MIIRENLTKVIVWLPNKDTMSKKAIDKLENGFEFLIFWSRWLQAPIYGGLIVASVIFSYRFCAELVNFVVKSNAADYDYLKLIMGVLTLVDLVMVINVLIMVIIGGYATFVSKLNIGKHEDRPAWLRSMDPGTLKVKLSASLVGVSGIHLLKAFIDVNHVPIAHVKVQAGLHLVFLISAIGLAFSEKLLHQAHQIEHDHAAKDKANAETPVKD